MKKFLLTAAIVSALTLPAAAQQQQQITPDSNAPVTLTYGELNTLIQSQVAQALAQQAAGQYKSTIDAGKSALDKVLEQVAKKPEANSTPVPAAPVVKPAETKK